MIKKTKTLLSILFASLFCSVCLNAQNNVIDQIIWVVGDEAILKSDVEHARLGMLSRGERIEGDPYCFIPEQLALQKLYLDQAKIDSIDVSTSDVNRGVTRYENNVLNSLGSKEKVEEYLGAPLNQLRENWREEIRNNYMVERAQEKIIGKVNLSPSEVRKYYSQLSQDSLPYIPTTVETQIITFEPQIPQKEIDKVKEQLRDFTNRVNNGESFSTLAIMYSEDGSAQLGGELGFMPRSQLVPEFANVAFSLSDPKKVSNIVESEYGYHIIQLIERRGDRINVRHILMRPKVPANVLDSAIVKMDSLVTDIRNNKFTFEDATVLSADKDTKNNNGLMVNHKDATGERYNTSRFTMEELPPEVASAINGLKVGEISSPFKMKLEKNQKDVVAIVKLRSRTEGHIANVSDDYQALKVIVENEKKQEILKKWMQKKIKNTYIYIDDNWKNCDFQFDWIKPEK